MAAQNASETDSSVPSSTILPLKLRSRRASVISMSSISPAERAALSQALDQIHSTASQFEGLTTFNQFAAPPSSSSGNEGKGIASDLHGGLSGLYNRFRASVGGVKDATGPNSDAVDGGNDDASSIKSNSTALSVTVSSTKQSARGIRHSSPSATLPARPKSTEQIIANSHLHSSVSQDSNPSSIKNYEHFVPKDGVSTQVSSLKPPLPISGGGKAVPALAQAGIPTAAEPSVVEVNVTATKTANLNSRASSQGRDSSLEKGSGIGFQNENDGQLNESSAKPRLGDNGNSMKKVPSHDIKEHRTQSLWVPHTSASEPANLLQEMTRLEDERRISTKQKDTSEVKGDAHDRGNSADVGENKFSSAQQGFLAAVDRKSSGREEIPGAPSSRSSIDQRISVHSDSSHLQRSTTRAVVSASGSQQPPRLPGLNLSRVSSTETGGGSSINTTIMNRSLRGDISGEDTLQIPVHLLSKSTATTQASGDTRGVNVVLSQIRSKVLSKEYWMKDENARDCFYCGDPFSTFRRKHHCRTCGQIFDAKCTSLVSGKPFGQSGTLRVCKPCEDLINSYDDSSEFSDDGSVMGTGLRVRHGSKGASDFSTARAPGKGASRGSETPSKLNGNGVPTMAIPATRRMGDDSNRRLAILEIDAERRLPRPGSSRSLKSLSLGTRQFNPAHKRHQSRSLLHRGFKPVSEDSAPFHHDPDNDLAKKRLPAFHSDNIIDPDLEQFLSDDDSSGEEQISIMSALTADGAARSVEHDRHALSGFLGTSKKSRSRLGDKVVSGVNYLSRDIDDTSSRLANISRNAKRRNLSISSNIHLRPSPRTHRFSTASPAMSSYLQESLSNSTLNQLSSPGTGLRVMRSSSMKGVAAPAVELNNASIQHVRKLLRQLLQDAAITNVGSWEKALMPILLQATDDVNPNVQKGDDIDIRHYVKLKKIPGGRPGDTSYVSGLVFTKNLALKSMPRSIAQPNILILTFPLEYARHQQHFMSLEPVIRQEKEFLQNLVHRIAALRPQLLLVQRNISGLALEFLEQANIATAYNVKASVLEAISRCSQSRIISSIDKLAIKSAQASKCASFSLKTYVYGGKRKTYMYLSGCPKELGCTIVLRGGDKATLVKIKRVTEFMIYVVYNLKLETCLMRDEFALIPSYTGEGSISPHKVSTRKRDCQEQCTPVQSARLDDGDNNKLLQPKAGLHVYTNEISREASLQLDLGVKAEIDEIQLPDDIPMPTFYSDMVEKHKTKILSASPFVKFMQPHLLMRAREQERRLLYLKHLCDQDLVEVRKGNDAVKPQKFVLIKPDMIHEKFTGTSRKFQEVLRAVHDAEYDKALHNYRTQKKQWETYISSNFNMFDPFAHQNIAVLYSVVCTVTTVPCSGPDLLALGFYNEHEIDEDFEADCTLGQYVEDLCLGAHTICTANGCERKMFEHHRQYVHGNAQLSVTVEHHPCELRGLQDSILMWSNCRICQKSTQVMPMSDDTWKYSFGKYLELSFWSSDLHARAGVCPHDLHRDHLRYFGFKDIALCIRYDPINILEIVVPRTRITWKVANDLAFKNEVFSKTEERINKYMLSVKARIKSIKVDSVVPDKADSCKEEVDKLMKRAVEEHQSLIRKLQEKYMDSKYYEVIPLNRAVRATQEKVADWDTIFAEFANDFFPSEKDIRRLATLQLKKLFLDRDESVASVSTADEGTDTPPTHEGELAEKLSIEGLPNLETQARNRSPEMAHDVLDSTAKDQAASFDHADRHQSAPTTSIPIQETQNSQPERREQISFGDIHHLDLAVPPSFPEKVPEPYTVMHTETLPISLTTTRDKVDMNDNDVYKVNEESSGAAVMDRPLLKEISSSSTVVHVSGIPRASDLSIRRAGNTESPALYRMQSQPAQMRREHSSSTTSFASSSTHLSSKLGRPTRQNSELLNTSVTDHAIKHTEKKLSDRLGLGALKASGHSMIPRSIANRRKDSRVSTLAKHFEQLSREFEKERMRERRQRAAKTKQARAYPMASSKPIVEVYRNVHDAVEEQEASDEESPAAAASSETTFSSPTTAEAMSQSTIEQAPGDEFHEENTNAEDTAAEDTAAEDTAAENTETDDNVHVGSDVGSDAEEEDMKCDGEKLIPDALQDIPDPGDVLSASETQLDLKLGLPKHEKSSLMKILTNFWAERSASGWQALEYPLSASDHVFADSDILIREDEPSSLIAFALGSEDYKVKLQTIQDKSKDFKIKHNKSYVQDPLLSTEEQKRIECSLLQSTGTHVRYQYQEGSAKMSCKIFYAEQFDAVRRKCGVTDRIVESLSRCMKWDSKGGKTKSVFLKTLDDRLVLKSLSPIETQAFLRFAPAYFQLMGEALFHDLPSVIAKMLGFYQIIIKNPVTGVEFNWFVLLMENLFYDRSPTRIFDLKGSMRNRRIQSTGEQNEVLLDENMVEFIYESPLFVREHSKRLLRASVWNDTLFLARQNVMDYSLMIAIDEKRKELVIGVIDCIRTYTWDKKLESWMKDRGKNRPTVTSPKEYKNRFREAMERYVLQAPNCWHQFQAQHLEPQLSRYRALQITDVEGDGETPIEES